MMAFVTAARIAHRQNGPQSVEAELFGQQTIERFRNRIADRPAAEMPWPEVSGANLGKWQSDDLPGPGSIFPSNNDLSILTPPGASRVYCVFNADCNSDVVIDAQDQCYGIQVKVCWNGTTCPNVGDACP